MNDHPKRPRDRAQLAKLIVDIATGEVEDREPTPEAAWKAPPLQKDRCRNFKLTHYPNACCRASFLEYN
jgi:hypothetical protein